VIGCGVASGPAFPACLLGCVKWCGGAGLATCRGMKELRMRAERRLHSANI